jgi:hypothetical protein
MFQSRGRRHSVERGVMLLCFALHSIGLLDLRAFGCGPFQKFGKDGNGM